MKLTADSSRVLPNAPAAWPSVWASPVAFWALGGTAMTLFSAFVLGQWVFSPDQFAAVPLNAADAMPQGTAMLRAVEVVSTSVMLWAFWHYLVRPWRHTGTPPLAGLLLAGALITYVLDTTVNFHDFHMAFNKHSINLGTWGAFFPGHRGPVRYAEAAFWGPPMYVYFGVALGTIQLKVLDLLRPRLGLALTLVACFLAAFFFDLAAENAIIRLAQGYAWPYTVGALSLWSGRWYQFPLYESLLVATYASLYTALLLSARRHGSSFIERGSERLQGAARTAVRLMAATGFAALCTSIYFGGFFAFSQFADSKVALPSYLMYADTDWSPAP